MQDWSLDFSPNARQPARKGRRSHRLLSSTQSEGGRRDYAGGQRVKDSKWRRQERLCRRTEGERQQVEEAGEIMPEDRG